MAEPATSLYPFGVKGGDQEYVRRMVDFNSPLFKPEIGFPFGKSLRDALYVSAPLGEHIMDVLPFGKNKQTQKWSRNQISSEYLFFFLRLKWLVSATEAKSYPSQQITSYFGQFTDNGQIIFPPTDNYVPSNPNPPPWGFTGRESLPMVAAFWDDADFSKGVGTTWYQVRTSRGDLLGESSSLLSNLIFSLAIWQEYSTLSSTQNPVVQDVEAKIEKYLKIPYVAKWTLKVTWDKAPAYPSRRDDTQVRSGGPR